MGKFKDKHGKTAIQAFLGHAKNVSPKILELASDITGIEMLDNLGEMIKGDPDMSEEDKAIAINLLDLQYKDLENAREMNARIQESQNASWLAKNMAYVLDGVAVGTLIFALAGLFFVEIPKENSAIVYTIVGAIVGYAGATYNFHRGSSSGSEKKSRVIENMMKEK